MLLWCCCGCAVIGIPRFSAAACEATIAANFDGVVAVTEAFLPMLLHAGPSPGRMLSTSSGVGYVRPTVPEASCTC